jgi:hypothetical protein
VFYHDLRTVDCARVDRGFGAAVLLVDNAVLSVAASDEDQIDGACAVIIDTDGSGDFVLIVETAEKSPVIGVARRSYGRAISVNDPSGFKMKVLMPVCPVTCPRI